MKRVALIFLAGLALGFVIHVGLSDRGSGRAPAQSPVQMPAQTGGGQAGDVPGGSAAPERGIDRVPDGVPGVRGRITDDRGQPLAGVRVHPRPNRRLSYETSGREAVFDPVKTGPDGRYAFEGSSDSPAGVYPVLEGYDFWLIRQDAPGASGAAGEWNFLGARRPGGGLEIHVYYPDGAVADGAELEWTSGTRRHRETWLAQDGSRKPVAPPFGGGSQEIRAFLGDWLRSDKVSVDVRGSAPRSLELRLKPIPSITGVLTIPPGLEGGATGVEVYCVPGGAPGRPDPSRPGSDWRLATVLPGQSEFGFLNIENGDYFLVIHGRGKRPDVVRAVTIKDERAFIELTLPPPTPPYVRVEVPDPKVIGIAGMSFSVYALAESQPGEATTGAGGPAEAADALSNVSVLLISSGRPTLRGAASYEIPISEEGVRAVSALNTKVVIVGTSLTFGSKAAFVPRAPTGELETLTFRFEAPSEPVFNAASEADLEGVSLEGKLIPRGSGLEALLPMLDGVFSAQDGSLRFPPMQAGSFGMAVRMKIATSSGDAIVLPLTTLSITLASGPQAQPLPLPRRYPVLLAMDPREGVPETALSLRSMDFPWTAFYRGPVPDGSRELTRLPAGKYVLRVEGVDGIMHFQLPSEGVLRFTPEAEPAIRVVLSAAPGILETAGVQDGDLVVGDAVDRFGWPAEAVEFIDRMIRTAADKVRLTVRRGRETLVLEVEVGKMTEEQRRKCFVLKD